MNFSKGLIWLSRIVFVVTLIIVLFNKQMDHAILLTGSIVLTFVPELFMWVSKVTVPMGGRLFYGIFIFGSQYLGSYLGFYTQFEWWDVLLHASSGVFIGYIALIVLVTVDRSHVVFIQKKTALIVTFIFLTGVAAAGIWEIIEFTGDTFLGTFSQLGSLQDTMEDIICGTVGGGVFAAYIWYVLHAGKKSCIDPLLALNPPKK